MPNAGASKPPLNAWSLLSGAGFEIDGEDQLSSLHEKYPTEPSDADGRTLGVNASLSVVQWSRRKGLIP